MFSFFMSRYFACPVTICVLSLMYALAFMNIMANPLQQDHSTNLHITTTSLLLQSYVSLLPEEILLPVKSSSAEQIECALPGNTSLI
jgi:hypothetical protein